MAKKVLISVPEPVKKVVVENSNKLEEKAMTIGSGISITEIFDHESDIVLVLAHIEFRMFVIVVISFGMPETTFCRFESQVKGEG